MGAGETSIAVLGLQNVEMLLYESRSGVRKWSKSGVSRDLNAESVVKRYFFYFRELKRVIN